jgi:hypothetical protein
MAHQRPKTISYRFDVMDQELNKIGEIHPDMEASVPNLTNNINRTIKRSLDGMVLLPGDFANVDPLSDRLKVWGVIDGVENALGVFMWTDASGSRHSFGLVGNSSLVDLNGILDQPMGHPLGCPADSSIDETLRSLALEVGLTRLNLPNTGKIMGQSANFASSISRTQVMAQLAGTAGLYSPYFDGNGVLTAKYPAPLDSGVLSYSEADGNIVADTIIESNDLLSAPNRWVCEVVGANDAPIWAAYDVPASAPHSFANRGYYIVNVIQGAQGIATIDECYEAAKAAALAENDTYEWVEFDAVPDHSHDTFDVVNYRGAPYREQEWRLPLSSAGLMHHSLRRHYE